MLHLRITGLHDWQFLYDLLAERPEHANISHKAMPTIAEHIGFLRSNPYQAWYIIEQDRLHEGIINRAQVGSVYLSKADEIGIAIAKEWQHLGLAKIAIEEIMRLHPKPRYLANIAPDNFVSSKLFMELGYKLIQNTFEFSHT